tara:strand:+ start:7928 stop:8416 length:489 start_codon:yes stop_codon:yes gene_type:complete
MGTWTNNDGLKVRFGADGVEDTLKGGSNGYVGAEREYSLEFDYTDLEAINTATIIDIFNIPDNFQVTSVTLQNLTPFDSASDAGTLDIGVIQTDRTTAVDLDGLGDGITQTQLNANNFDTTTGTAVLVGTTLTNGGYLTLTERSAAFTAGKGRILIRGFTAA